jgi:hypothetical protein
VTERRVPYWNGDGSVTLGPVRDSVTEDLYLTCGEHRFACPDVNDWL